MIIDARNYSDTSFFLLLEPPPLLIDSTDVTVERVGGCCETMALSDIFPIFMVAGALWILVYCILMTQKIFMDSHYQEIQPKRNGEEDDVEHLHPPPSPRQPKGKKQLESPKDKQQIHLRRSQRTNWNEMNGKSRSKRKLQTHWESAFSPKRIHVNLEDENLDQPEREEETLIGDDVSLRRINWRIANSTKCSNIHKDKGIPQKD